MCQPKSKGGRRCAAHHPSTLSMKFIVKEKTILQEGQINHIFNALRHNNADQPAPTKEEYQAFLENQKERVQSNTSLSDTAKKKALQKLEKASLLDQIPEGKDFYALKNLERISRRSAKTLADSLRQIAQDQGSSPRRMFSEFKNQYNATVGARSKADYSQVFDAKTTSILENLESQTPKPVFEETPRITRTSSRSQVVSSYGYDPEDGRLEVEHTSGEIYAFHSVDEDTYNRFKRSPSTILPAIAMNENFAYENTVEAKTDAYRVWCEACSRFRLASGHVCQENEGTEQRKFNLDEIYNSALRRDSASTRITPVNTPRWVNGDTDNTVLDQEHVGEANGSHARGGSTNSKRILPDPVKVRELMAEGKKVEVQLGRKVAKSGSNGTEFNEVTVPATFRYTNGNVHVEQNIDYSQAKCTCEQYQVNGRCKHLYPQDDSDTLNELVRKDILKSALNIRGYNQRSPIWREAGNVFLLNEDSQLTEENLNDMRYILMNNGQDNTAFMICKQTETDSGNARFDTVGNITYQGDSGNFVMQSRSYGDTEQQALLNAAERQLKEELQSSNFLASRLAVNAERVLSGWEVSSESRDPYLQRFTGRASDGYLANPEEFLRDYKDAMSRRHEPDFIVGTATNGLISTGPGRNARGFGVEIEFVGADADEIAIALHDAGLANADYVHRYHASNSYTSWRMEDDCTVSGEIVSPILYDNEESWRQLAKVCEIAKSFGARGSRDAGAHVHIGASGLTMRNQLGVVAAATAHQDVIRRITTNPQSGTHRTTQGNVYTRAFNDDDVLRVYRQVSSSSYHGRSLHYDRHSIISPNERGGTLEFRDPDGTLDPSHMQSQVILASALVSAGESGNWDDLTASTHRTQRIGFNAQRENMINNEVGEDNRILASNISLMTTLDTLFSDKETRTRMLRAAVRSPWQSEYNSRRRGW